MKKLTFVLTVYVVVFTILFVPFAGAEEKQTIKAVGIPLADHYAGVVAFEKYRSKMKYADYQLLILPGPDFVRAYSYLLKDSVLDLIIFESFDNNHLSALSVAAPCL